jgi:hypothetical protein
MVKHVLTVALVKSVFQVLDRMGPTGIRRRRRRPRHHDRRGRWHQQQQLGVTLDLDRLHRTGGDPGAGSLRQPPINSPNPRARVLERTPSPSPDPPTYKPMEPSDPAASLWGHREPPCVVHGIGTGPCPYLIAQWQPMFSSSGKGKGEEVVEEEEDEANEEEEEEEEEEEDDDDVVVIAVIDKDDEPVEVIPVLKSTPPRSSYKQTTQIQIGPRGLPIKTLAPRVGAREAGPTGSTVWPLPPPPPPSEPFTTTPPPPSISDSSIAPPSQDPTVGGKQPPLWSPIRGRILRLFAHLMKLSRPSR